MKNLVLSLLAILTIILSMTSCEQDVELDNPEVTESISFTAADQTIGDIPDINEFVESSRDNDLGELRSCQCGAAVSSLGLAVAPWGLINLNVKYRLGESDHQVRIFHYRLIGSSWVYYGYGTIGSSTLCVNKSVNMSTGQLPSGYQYWSGAKVYDPSSGYCGSWKTLKWTL